MALIRPAGMSDDESDSEDEFYIRPKKKFFLQQPTEKKRIENTLQEAIINGNIKEVEEIISNDLKNMVNVKLDSGWTPLMHACFHAQDQIVKFLLDQGADPNLHADSVTPIMAACSNSSANNDTINRITTSLIEKDCLLNIGDKYGQTPLMRAISSGRVAVVERLLDMRVNIESRDVQGWTPLFWAVHHNQPEILELLIKHGARLTEVDKSSRTSLDIAKSHDYENIIQILNKHLHIEEDEEDDNEVFESQMTSWYDYYPGITKAGKPNYISEIPPLLYGMSCEQLGPIMRKSGIDLRTFLLLEEADMDRLGIHMVFQKRRLRQGLRSFHKRTWKLNAVAGLFASKNDNFSVLDCLTTLGSHLQQVYILEATLQYSLREYGRVQNQLKFEPPDSPLLSKTKTASKKLITNINDIRVQIKEMRKLLKKISKNNPEPADLIKDRSMTDIAKDYATEALVFCSLGLVVYHARNYFTNMLAK